MALSTPPLKATTPTAQLKKVKARPWMKFVLIGFTAFYLGLVLLIPAVNVFIQAFQGGLGGFLSTFADRTFLQAVRLTLIIAAITVPINTIFGLCAAWAIARHKFPGRTLLLSLIDLPFSVSPVVAGLMLVLLLSLIHI
jgi:sulfate transport system permease protein